MPAAIIDELMLRGLNISLSGAHAVAEVIDTAEVKNERRT